MSEGVILIPGASGGVPAAHASTHIPGGTDVINMAKFIDTGSTNPSSLTIANYPAGCLYLHTTTNVVYRSDGSAWTPLSLALTGSGAPTFTSNVHKAGMLYARTSNNTLYYCDGSAWTLLAGGAAATPLVDLVLANGQSANPSTTARWTGNFVPVFYPMLPPPGLTSFVAQGVRMHFGAGLAGSTAGLAIYTISYTGAQAFTCTKVVDLGSTTTISIGAVAGVKSIDLNGAPITLDYTANRYVMGVIVSDATTVMVAGQKQANASGAFLVGAQTDCTPAAFPSTFTSAASGYVGQTTTSVANVSNAQLASVWLATTTGKNYWNA